MIRTDTLAKRMYATDASMYEELPFGVSLPKTVEDIQELVKSAYKQGFTITARSAGTSLAGQATGNGVIMDVSKHMTSILEINAKERYARAQPGVIRDTLNREALPLGLLFGPDTSTTDRCMVGGMIGNNSSGSYSIKHKTTREHVLEMDVVLSDGSLATFKALSPEEVDAKVKLVTLEGHIYRSIIQLVTKNKDAIIENFPHAEIIRRNTGYALDKLCTMYPIDPNGRPFNMCELLTGSEGTLALTVSAKLNLVPQDKFQRLLIPQFKTIQNAMKATVEAVKFGPSAVELVDDIILNATKGNLEHAHNRFFLEGEPKCILIIQFEGNDEAELAEKTKELAAILAEKGMGYTYADIGDIKKQKRVWNLRRAGLGLLMGLGKDSRSPTFCEDTAVRVVDLPAYIAEFEELLARNNANCVFYAHASVGELHLRPLIDTTKQEGVDKMKKMASEVADLVRKYRGSLSGEHGDGRARAPYIEQVLGSEMMPILQRTKEIWDPQYIFNPGKIVDAKPIDADLRFSPSYQRAKVETVFKYRKEGSFNDAIELCNGAGVCRKLAASGGNMCPSYMATEEEKDSTRGRANVFRHVFSGANPETFASEDLKEALDLCLSCKACKSECPANVDMAKMKAEFLNGWHQIHGVKLSERFFADAGKFYPLASKLPGISNWFLGTSLAKGVLDSVIGISKERTLPQFAKQSFGTWFKKNRAGKTSAGKSKAVLFVDIFTNYHDPEIAISALKILEKLGFEVIIPKVNQAGRPQISKGLLNDAKKVATKAIKELGPLAEQGIPVIGLEPSEILTVRDEFLDLCENSELETAKVLAKNSYTIEEFVVKHKDLLPEVKPGSEIKLLGHCHTKSLTGNEMTVEALQAVGYQVDEMDAGCCGMAGSFGYEKNHYELSMKIGNQRLFPQLRADGGKREVCAPGFSCRHQIHDGVGVAAKHPAIMIAEQLSL